MKTKIYMCNLALAISIFITMHAQGQTIADFDNNTLFADTFWNGSSKPMGTSFKSGNAIFPNYFDTTYGPYWTGGWAYSDIHDISDTTKSLYAAITDTAHSGSNYAIGQQGSIIKLNEKLEGHEIKGFYITNLTYLYNTLKKGNHFSKVFGGSSGNDPDYFVLTIKNYFEGALNKDSVNFFLADYRFADNSKDYIVKDWEHVDLTSLGNCDSLVFAMSSSDVGEFGINTPLFFCIDDLTINDVPTVSLNELDKDAVLVFPNPVTDKLQIQLSNNSRSFTAKIHNLEGQVVMEKSFNGEIELLDVQSLPNGVYFLEINSQSAAITRKIFKY